jgi:hypothetical protein
VYVIKDIKFSASYEELVNANSMVASHTDNPGATTVRRTTAAGQTATQPGAPSADSQTDQPADQQTVVVNETYELTDPHHPSYGQVLIGENRDEIKCTIVVNYLFYRADNITPQ